MQPPRPKAEISVQPCGSDTLFIHYASPDARAQIEAEAPAYGKLFENRGMYILTLSPLFDSGEVARYLGRDGIVLPNSVQPSKRTQNA